MEPKVAQFGNRGMQQDTSISKSSNEFAFENRNIRITAINGDTLLSVTNEKGPKIENIAGSSGQSTELLGTFLGHYILGKYIIVFTTETERDHIYRIELVDDGSAREPYFKCISLFSGDLNFSVDNPIEATGYYESEDIQKVYWVDGVNQPRLINIKYKELTGNPTYTQASQVDFVRTLPYFPQISVEKITGSNGMFPSGVIQYIATFYNKYGSETSIIAYSDLNYITHPSRGAKPDEVVNCSFKITVTNVCGDFDYLRLYSIKRSSLEGPLEVQIVGDFYSGELSHGTLTTEDNNINQEVVDSSTIYYLGGEDFIAGTLEQKDNTLFFGNIKLKESPFTSNEVSISSCTVSSQTISLVKAGTSFYDSTFELGKSSSKIKYFKAGETYCFGVQLQDRKGKWSPIKFATSYTVPLNDNRPINDNDILKIKQLVLGSPTLSGQSTLNWVNYRVVMAETSVSTRRTLAQGILSPTVFNYQDRSSNSPYAIGSWVARPRKEGNFAHMQSITSPIEIQCNDDVTTPFTSSGQQITTVYKYAVVMNTLIGNLSTDGRLLRVYAITSDIDWGQLSSINVELLNQRYFATENWNKAIDYANQTLKGWGYDFSLSTMQCIVEHNPDYNMNSSAYVNYNMGGWAPLPTGYTGFVDWWCYYGISAANAGGTAGVVNKNSYFFIDNSILTLHSPDIESSLQSIDDTELKFRIIGTVPISNSIQRATVDIGPGTAVFSETINNYSETRSSGETLFSEELYQDGLLVKTVEYPSGHRETPTSTTYKFESKYLAYYKLYMWHKTGSVLGVSSNWEDSEGVSPAELRHKIFATERYSGNTEFLQSPYVIPICKPRVATSTELVPIKLEVPTLENSNGYVYYQNNYDKLIAPLNNYTITVRPDTFTEFTDTDPDDANVSRDHTIGASDDYIKDPVRVKYKTTPAAVFSLGVTSGKKYVLPRANDDEESNYTKEDAPTQFWSSGLTHNSLQNNYPWNNSLTYFQESLSSNPSTNRKPYLYVAELYRDLTNPYGDITNPEILEKLKWIPCSQVTPIGQSAVLEGDTYYQRYDAFTSYPFTEDDENSVVDITSFMVESHINLDGRCDINKGGTELTSYRPGLNFNLMNSVYSQENNIFEYNILDEKYNLDTFKNQITWSLTKNPTDDIDTWTHITLLNLLNLDGTYGAITELACINNALFAFQDNALCRINYNDRMQISTEQNTPIEVQNSGKVNGYTYISKQIGCKNKWSICQSNSGIYFTDTEKKSLYRINAEGLADVSASAGMSMWFKKNISNNPWKADWSEEDSAKISYDAVTNDVYVSTDKECIVYNEGLQSFTSFLPYKQTPLLFSLDSKSLMMDTACKLYTMFAGDYNVDKEGNPVDYSVKYKINPEPLINKTFTNIDLLADYTDEDGELVGLTPFSKLTIWNEHQLGEADLEDLNQYLPEVQKNKFRVWRIQVPRDKKNSKYGLDRIQNPWIYLQLDKTFNWEDKEEEDIEKEKNLMTLHSLLVKYFK